MARFALTVLLVTALVAGAAAYCKTDSQCPSYHGPPPYNCHACFDFCCETNQDCESKCTTGSYCMKYPGKHGPFFCHVPNGGSCNITNTDATTPSPSDAPVALATPSADGFECWMCQKLEPTVGDHDCKDKCEGWWPFLRGTCTSVCDDLVRFAGRKAGCVLAGYCSA